MSGWDVWAGASPAVGEFVADTPGRAPASSAALLVDLRDEDEVGAAAAAALEALVAAPQAAAEALSPRLVVALQQIPVPTFLIETTPISMRNPLNSGRQPIYQAALDLAREAAAAGTQLAAVRPCVVIRIPHPTSPQARRLLRRFDHFLHGTAQVPLPAAVQQARQAEVDRFRTGVAAALQHATDPHDKALLELLHKGAAYFEPLCCFEPLRAVVQVPAAAEIRIAGCLGPATSAAAASLARVLALGAGDHKRRLAQPQATEVLSKIKALAQVQDLSPLGPLLRDARVRFKSTANMFKPFQDAIACGELLHISKQKALHSSDRDLLGGLTKPGFTALLCICLSPSTLKDMGMGCREDGDLCEIHLGKDDVNHLTALARTMCGDEGDVCDELVAEFDASPPLLRLFKTANKKLAIVHQIFCCVPLTAADKLPILRLMRSDERAARYYLDNLAGELGLVQLRFIALHGLRIGLSRVGQWPSVEPILPGGAAGRAAARLEALGAHNLPEDVWAYGEEDWQLVGQLPLHCRMPAEAIVLDMYSATRPRCYGLCPMLDYITRPGCRLSEEEWEALRTHMAAVVLARYQGRLVADVQATLGAEAAAALLGSPAALAALAAIDQLCSEWLPEGDMYVSATQLDGRRLLCVPGDDICQLPEAGTYLGWAVELERPGVRAALSGRFAPDVEKRRRELAKRPKPPAAAAAAALPAATERGAAAAAAAGGSSAALGLADVGSRPEAALHNATETALAQYLALTGHDDASRVAATVMQLVSSHADDVLRSGRVPDDAVYEAFQYTLPPGMQRSAAMARMRTAAPSIIDKSLSRLTKQALGGPSWAAAGDDQFQAALQTMQQQSGGTHTGVHMLRCAAAAAATGQQRQQQGAATPADPEGQQEGYEDAAEEDDAQVGQLQQQRAAAAAAASDAEEEEAEEDADAQQQDSEDENLPQEPHMKRQRTGAAAAAGGAHNRPVLGPAQQRQQQQRQQQQEAPHVAPAAFQVPRLAVDAGGGGNSGGVGRGSGGGGKRPTLGPARRVAMGV